MALHSLQYGLPDQHDEINDAKVGLMSYDGSAHGFRERAFMTSLAKLDSTARRPYAARGKR